MLLKTRSVLAVHNLKIAVPFYRDVMGMKIEFEPPGWCFMSRGSFFLMLGECPNSMEANDLGDHSYFVYVTVSDSKSLFEEFTQKSIDVIKLLTDEPWGMREFGVRTIDGHRIMFGQELEATESA